MYIIISLDRVISCLLPEGESARDRRTALCKAIINNNNKRALELCEIGGGRPGLPVPNSPYVLCGRKAAFEEEGILVQSSGVVLN